MDITLILGAATSLLKIHNRGDQIFAARRAVKSDLFMGLPTITINKHDFECYNEYLKLSTKLESKFPADLKQAIARMKQLHPGGFNDDIKESEYEKESEILAKYAPVYLPEFELTEDFGPTKNYLAYLKENYPDLYQDKDFLRASLLLQSGDTQIPSAMKSLALATADVIAEFGSAYVSSFINHKGTQELVGGILKRVEKLNLDEKSEVDAKQLSKLFLSATLNGALNQRGNIKTDNKWLGVVLDAVVEARETSEDKDAFIQSLLDGQGYTHLVGTVLGETAGLVTDVLSDKYKEAVKGMLVSVGGIIKKEDDFSDFLKLHWSDIAIAGFKTFAAHGDTILGGSNELLKDVLVAVADRISSDEKYLDFSKQNISDLTSTALLTIAANPELVKKDGDTGEWVAVLAESIASTLKLTKDKEGNTTPFSLEGLRNLASQSLKSIAKRPDLINSGNKTHTALVTVIVEALSDADLTNVESLASATLSGALKAVEGNPGLLSSNYPETAASLAKSLGKLVSDNAISSISAEQILSAALSSMANNPIAFTEFSNELAGKVVSAVIKGRNQAPAGLAKEISIARLVAPILDNVARYGKNYLDGNTEEFVATLTGVVANGLKHADDTLGITTSLADAPSLVSQHVAAHAQGKTTPEERTLFVAESMTKTLIV